MKKILVLHGPNINLTGIREPGTYGKDTLETINEEIRDCVHSLGMECDIFQSNHEGALIDKIHEALEGYDWCLYPLQLRAPRCDFFGQKALRRGTYVQHPRERAVPSRIGDRTGMCRTDLRIW